MKHPQGFWPAFWSILTLGFLLVAGAQAQLRSESLPSSTEGKALLAQMRASAREAVRTPPSKPMGLAPVREFEGRGLYQGYGTRLEFDSRTNEYLASGHMAASVNFTQNGDERMIEVATERGASLEAARALTYRLKLTKTVRSGYFGLVMSKQDYVENLLSPLGKKMESLMPLEDENPVGNTMCYGTTCELKIYHGRPLGPEAEKSGAQVTIQIESLEGGSKLLVQTKSFFNGKLDAAAVYVLSAKGKN